VELVAKLRELRPSSPEERSLFNLVAFGTAFVLWIGIVVQAWALLLVPLAFGFVYASVVERRRERGDDEVENWTHF
jgi:hypothetical protein